MTCEQCGSKVAARRPCIDCGVDMMGTRAWGKLSPEERKSSRDRGFVRQGSRSRCVRCHGRVRRRENPKPPRSRARTEIVVEDWKLLADPELSQNANIRNLAPRMGMTVYGLQAAILRAKRYGLLGRAA